MKQLLGVIRLGALTVLSVALHRGKERTEILETTHNHHFKSPIWQPASARELVLLNIDGTVFAREVNLTPQGV